MSNSIVAGIDVLPVSLLFIPKIPTRTQIQNFQFFLILVDIHAGRSKFRTT